VEQSFLNRAKGPLMIMQRVVSKLFFCFLLGLLGFLGNWFRLELFFNVDYLIGSLFVMLAIQMLGGGYGVMAGFIAATCSYFLWHHPWAIFIMTGEALFVAWVYARRKGNIVIYDAIYWSIIGMPLIYLFYHQVMGMQLQSTLLIMFKQSINGILNSLLALTLYILIKHWKFSKEEPVPYSRLIFAIIATLVLLPAMLLLIIGMRVYSAKEKEILAADLSYTAEEAQNYLAGWVKEHHLTVQTLSELVGDPDTTKFSEMQRYVETLKAATPAFYRMGILNKDAITVAYSPLEADGKSTLGVDFSDRPYISIMKEKKRPYIPDVMMGKLGKPTPIALLLAPIVVGGEYKGYASGVIDVKELSTAFTHILKQSNSNVTLVDGHWRVIASSLADQKIMSPFLRPYNSNREIPVNEAFHWVPEPEPGTSIMQRWRDSLLVKAVPLSPDYGWKVIVEEPILPIVQHVSRFSIYGLGLLGILTIVTVAILQLFSKGIVSTVVTLQRITTFLPERLAGAAEIAWPESKIMELQGLCSNFQKMAASLQERQAALRRLNDELEQRVEARTQELQETIARLQEEMGSRQRAEEILKESEERVRYLATQLLEAVEKERKRISMDLHDDVGQSLLALRMQLNTMLRQSPSEPSIRQGLKESAGYLLEIIDKVRNLSHALSPATLGKLSLTEAVRELLEEFQKYHDIITEADLDEVGPLLPQEARVGIYRILQEFLANVNKHAQATKVKVAITALEDRVAVTMEDNGIGFNLEEVRGKIHTSGGLGLLTIEGRVQMLGGRFSMNSQIAQGTCLHFEIPRTPEGEFSGAQG
jgi:signal transduction histidine kinase